MPDASYPACHFLCKQHCRRAAVFSTRFGYQSDGHARTMVARCNDAECKGNDDVNNVPSPLLELITIEMEREAERQSQEARRGKQTLRTRAVQAKIGRGMILAGKRIMGSTGSGA